MPAASLLELPAPILFHPLKHHLLYQQEFVKGGAALSDEAIKAALLSIGSSQLDLYLGGLAPLQLAEEVITQLGQQELLSAAAYQNFLSGTGTDFRTLTLSDGTDWVLRWGLLKHRHVHLHPARYALHTERVKANTLKTAIGTTLAMHRSGYPQADLQLINQVRVQWLGLSPVKATHATEGVQRLISMLRH